MNKQDVFQEISMLLVQLFELKEENIKLESKLYEDLDLDSIDAIDLIVQLQKKIKKSISPEMFKAVRTVEDVVSTIESLVD